MARFEDDETVYLDCGCICGAGEDYEIDSFKVMNKATGKLDEITIKHCGDPDCCGKCLEEVFSDLKYASAEVGHVFSADEKEQEYELAKGEW